MITKQKIKQLEESLNKLRGDKVFYCMKKFDEEIYSYNRKIYYSLDSVERSIDFHTGDMLVIITDFQCNSFNNRIS